MNKTSYSIVSILIIITCVLAIMKMLAPNTVSAAINRGTETVSGDGYMTIGSIAKNDTNILWLLDTKGKKLLIYEYVNDMAIKLKAARDIQYDITVPVGDAFPLGYKPADPTPLDTKKLYESIKQ